MITIEPTGRFVHREKFGRFFGRQEIRQIPIARNEQFRIHGDVVTVFAGAEDTGGSYSFFQTDVFSRDSSFATPHSHLWQDETTYVHSGQFEFLLGDTRIVCQAGDVIHVPQRTVHTYRNIGSSPGALWAVVAPAGLEKFFRDVGTPHSANSNIPDVITRRPLSRTLLRKYGIAI
jgi:quercetin dioxygenase-like cupin family protein